MHPNAASVIWQESTSKHHLNAVSHSCKQARSSVNWPEHCQLSTAIHSRFHAAVKAGLSIQSSRHGVWASLWLSTSVRVTVASSHDLAASSIGPPSLKGTQILEEFCFLRETPILYKGRLIMLSRHRKKAGGNKLFYQEGTSCLPHQHIPVQTTETFVSHICCYTLCFLCIQSRVMWSWFVALEWEETLQWVVFVSLYKVSGILLKCQGKDTWRKVLSGIIPGHKDIAIHCSTSGALWWMLQRVSRWNWNADGCEEGPEWGVHDSSQVYFRPHLLLKTFFQDYKLIWKKVRICM